MTGIDGHGGEKLFDFSFRTFSEVNLVMIESLTPEQEAQLPFYLEKWKKISLDTGPIDFDLCVKWAKECYKAVGLVPPDDFRRVRGPDELAWLAKELGDEHYLDSVVYGYHDSGWLSFYDYCLNVLNVTGCDQIRPLIELSKECGWWLAYDTVAMICERPTAIHFNDRNVLHCEDGPALAYASGFQTWALDGNRVTEQIVLRPETLTVDQIHGETNADIRSIMIDRVGWPRYIELAGLEPIDSRLNPISNTLEQLYNSQNGTRLLATCPTGKIASMEVEEGITTCEEAQRWLGDVDGDRDGINCLGRT